MKFRSITIGKSRLRLPSLLPIVLSAVTEFTAKFPINTYSLSCGLALSVDIYSPPGA